MSGKQYKTPPARLAKVMEKSRDLWKERSAEKQRTIRSQRVTIRDLKASRDHWKAEALRTAEELRQLHEDQPQPSQPPSFTPPATTAVIPLGGQVLGEA